MTFMCECFQGSCTFLPGRSETGIPIATLDRGVATVPAKGLSDEWDSFGTTVIAVGQEGLLQADTRAAQTQMPLSDEVSGLETTTQQDISPEPDEPAVLEKSVGEDQELAEDEAPGDDQGLLSGESLVVGMPAPAAVPPMPNQATVTTKMHVPEEPFLFEPMVLSEEEFDMFFPVVTDFQEESDDFFADFFVVGADYSQRSGHRPYLQRGHPF